MFSFLNGIEFIEEFIKLKNSLQSFFNRIECTLPASFYISVKFEIYEVEDDFWNISDNVFDYFLC